MKIMIDGHAWTMNYSTILTFFETNLAGIEIFRFETETRGRLNSLGFFTLETEKCSEQ